MPTKLRGGANFKNPPSYAEKREPLEKLPSLPKYNVNKTPVAGVRARVSARNPDAPRYTWAPCGTTGVVHDNCYDYAFGSFSNKRTNKSVPGAKAKINSNGLTFTTCAGIVKRVLADNPITVKKVSAGFKSTTRLLQSDVFCGTFKQLWKLNGRFSLVQTN
jgi:hypothetical protein